MRAPDAGGGRGGGSRGGGFWIDPEQDRSRLVAPPQREAPVEDAWVEDAPRPPLRVTPTRRGHRRRLLVWMGLSVIVLGVLAILAALVWTGDVVVPGISAKLFPIHYQEEIGQAAEKYDQDPYLVAAIVRAESGYDPQASSGSGAVGLMQLMPATAEWVAEQSKSWPKGEAPDLTDPVDSLELGVWYLAYLGDIYGEGSLAALAAYNGGLGNVDDWIAEAGGIESFDASDISFPETRQYVERIEHYKQLYERIHPGVFSQAAE